MADFEESKMSKFNAGIALVERIDSLQRALNMARFNPLSPNQDTGTFNYQVMINANDGLLSECWAKLTDSEKREADRIRKLVHKMVELFPPIIQGQEGPKINKNNYRKFNELILIYEKMNKDILDSHNLNAPNVDADEGL